ncbi:MAG: S1 family peptidase [Burkholderiales bacterium]
MRTSLQVYLSVAFMGILSVSNAQAELSDTIDRIKPSILGVGTHQPTRNPAFRFKGTGFVVGDGRHVISNLHVLPPELSAEKKETLAIVAGRGMQLQLRDAVVAAKDEEHDLVLLKISGAALPAMKMGDSSAVKEGRQLAFTGFPIGIALGQHAVTHRGIVSAITPIVIPGLNSRQLDVNMINRLRATYDVFQLDATAYPGSSGSPLYDPDTGAVVGIINMVFVKGTKESALAEPSGITYAIPASYIRKLLREQKLVE